eukprot:SAG11_NODE_15692_length_569_cov_0.991489_1_plen_51_part_00
MHTSCDRHADSGGLDGSVAVAASAAREDRRHDDDEEEDKELEVDWSCRAR